MFWGFSEALNFYDEYNEQCSKEDPEIINILLFGNTDSRHILRTLAKSYKHNVKVNFYVLDGCIEIVARNMLLLAIAMDDPAQLTVKGKTHLFMDIFGNSLLRPISYNYMSSKAGFLRKLITDCDFLSEMAPIFNIDGLKYRERDGLEDAFNFWLPSDKHKFNIKQYWEDLNRKKLGPRFDYKKGAFDWDLQMCLKEKGAKQICPQEYSYWRETGVAFTFPEYEQCNPNKSLSAGLLKRGREYSHKGYVGDYEVGPYCCFGLKTKNEQMSKSFHGDNEYRATDLTEANLFEMFYEIEHKKELPLDEVDCHKYGSIRLGMNELLTSNGEEEIELKRYDEPFMKFENFQINFLPLEDAIEIPNGDKFKDQFDFVFVAANYFGFVKPKLLDSLKPNGCIYFETKAFSLWKPEATSDFGKRIRDFSKDNNFESITNFNINVNYSIAKFKRQNESK